LTVPILAIFELLTDPHESYQQFSSPQQNLFADTK
jgi:hypothetical protein